jgi:membrane fusion protein (multidrug efflux system)
MSQAITALPRDAVTAAEPATAGRARFRRWLRLVLMGGGVLAVLAGAGVYWLNGGRWMSSDDSYVNADKVAVATDVSGTVASIPIHEGEQVAKGQVLFQLDPKRFQIALDGAKADLAQTRITLLAERQDYQRMLHDIAARQAQVQADQATFDRYAQLVGRGDLPRQQYDDARYKLAADQAGLQSAGVAAQVALARLNGDPNVDVTTLPSDLQAQARVAEAQRELDRATVRAPYAGVVTQVSTLQPGMFLPAGTAAFGLVSSDHIWVDAQPKETELTWVKPGDPADVTVDTYPGHVWHGTVESISPASGSQFSILPAQNASGNWVKVVQRIPMRVRIETEPGDPALRAGMSAVVDVDTGHKRTLADLY